MPLLPASAITNSPDQGNELDTRQSTLAKVLASMSKAPHNFGLRVYYEDTDFSGIVYHASYLRFMERGRTEWLRELGVTHRALFEETGKSGAPLAFVVARMTIDFRRPAHVDDLLTIETLPIKVMGASITLAQRVMREAEVLVSAEVIVACVAGGQAQRLPKGLRDKIDELR